ncbi:MAG TPA: PAS domain-containing protein [Mesorhizobium sp.]|jgi:hypothetical protein|nr:PAS domain-containing protein [Mesorhizobium sp.]
MRQAASIALFQYWNRLRDGRPAPRRSEIEPADIRTLLSDTFILERDMRGEAVFRLAGTRLCGVHGRELKGYSFPSLWRARDQRLIAKLTQNVFSGRAVITLDYQGVTEKGRASPFELILLPLDGGRESPRCLGLTTAVQKPFWLGADPVLQALLDSFRVLDPDREPLFLGNRPALATPPLAPGEDALGGNGRGGRRVRHLVVLEGGKDEPEQA